MSKKILPGERFELNKKIYEIKEILLDGKVLTQDLSFGGTQNFTREDIAQYLFQGLLRFDVRGKNTKNIEEQHIKDYKWGDFSLINERFKNIAISRYKIIEPLVFRDRTLKDVTDRIAEVTNEKSFDFSKTRYINKPLTYTTLYRWIKLYEQSGGDIRSLIPSYDQSGANGISRLPEELDKIIASVVTSKYLNMQRCSIKSVFNEIKYQISKVNEFRDDDSKLKVPSYNTLRNKINGINPYIVSHARYGKKEADAIYQEVYAGGKKNATRPLETILIDHTHLDLFIVDEEDRLPIGRPYLTFAIDSATRYPLGFYIGFTPPSYSSVMECLYHSFVNKTYVKTLYPEIKDEWLAWGIPETIFVDNGKEFKSKSLEEACWQLNINLQFARPKTGQDKDYIERSFGTINTMLLHELPGTSFSSILDRKDYNPMKNAVIPMQAFEEILHHFIICVLSKLPRDYLGGISPVEAWKKGCEEYPPALPHNVDELIPLIGQVDYRQIGKSGIQFNELYYNSSELARIRMQLKKRNDKVRFKFHPKDLSRLYVWDDKLQKYITVFANNIEYASNLSLWKHKIILKNVRERSTDINEQTLHETRKYIEQLVDQEWVKTKKSKTRKRLARFKGIEGSIYEQMRFGKTSNIELQDSVGHLEKSITDQSSIEINSFETEIFGLEDKFVQPQISTKKNVKSLPKQKNKMTLCTKSCEDDYDTSPNMDGWS